MSQVLLKVAAINALYSTQIWGVYRAAERIVECDVETRLEVGDTSVVHDIASMEFSGKTRYNYSFATKYCSWHKPDLYPMYDSRVAFCLFAYQRQEPFAKFTQAALWDYEILCEVIKAFREKYELTVFSFKKIDEFLFQLGNEYFNTKEALPESSNADI